MVCVIIVMVGVVVLLGEHGLRQGVLLCVVALGSCGSVWPPFPLWFPPLSTAGDAFVGGVDIRTGMMVSMRRLQISSFLV